MKAYLHFGFGNEPRLTVAVPHKKTEQPLFRSSTGYGPRIPTEHMVKHEGRWRRVYVACYGNSGSAYIGPAGDWTATVGFE